MSILHFSSMSSALEQSNAIRAMAITSTLNFGNANISLATFSIATSIVTGIRDTSGGSGTATAEISFLSDGSSNIRNNTNVNTDSTTISTYNATTWYSDQPLAGLGNDYEVFAAIASGSGTGVLIGTFDSWTPMSATNIWSVQKTGNNQELSYTISIDFSIRDVATQTIRATGAITLSAQILVA